MCACARPECMYSSGIVALGRPNPIAYLSYYIPEIPPPHIHLYLLNLGELVEMRVVQSVLYQHVK